MRILLTLFFLIALPSFAFAGAECNKHDVRHEDLGCAAQALDNADTALNVEYKALLEKIPQENRRKLKEAQRAWILFRDADTALAYATSGEGGSLGGLIATNHKIDLTLERTKQLKEFLDATTN